MLLLVTGSSGAGKSTARRLIDRLTKRDPGNGGWAVHVVDTSELSPDQVAEQVWAGADARSAVRRQ